MKSLSPRFAKKKTRKQIEIPAHAPIATPITVARGAKIYKLMQCARCHGENGRGDGSVAYLLKDDRGRRIYPFDFTRSWKLKGGATAKHIFRTLHTGLDGTPMPSYSGVLSDNDTWALAHYIRSLFVQQDSN